MANQRSGDDSEALKQITDMWEGAKSQLQELRDAVERTSELGRAHSALMARRSDRELALLKLGEAFYKQVQSGEVAAPVSLKRLVGEVKSKDDEVARQQSDISAILEEADALVEKAKVKKKPAKK